MRAACDIGNRQVTQFVDSSNPTQVNLFAAIIGKIGDRVVAPTRGKEEEISSLATRQRVRPGIARKCVVAARPDQVLDTIESVTDRDSGVGTRIGKENPYKTSRTGVGCSINSRTAKECIGSLSAFENVIAIAAAQNVVPTAPIENIVSGATIEIIDGT